MEETKTQFGNSSKQNTSTGTSPTQDDEDYEPDEQTTVTYLANSNDGNFNQTGARINRSQTVKNTNGNNNIGQKNNQSLTGQMDNSDTQGSEFLRNKSLKDSPDRLKYTNNDKKLPPNFAERVLELEMELENDCTSIDSINNLLYLYSQAVEYYNGMNNDRFQLYADRIQNFLLKPEVLKVMQCASANPDGYKKEMEEKKLIKQQQLNQMDQGEARKAHQAEQERKKKERVQKMAQNMEDIQIPASEGGSSGVNSPEVKIQQFLDDQELKIEQAQKELKKEMSQQTENFQKRLEERKRKMKQNKKSVNNSRMCMEQEETKNESQSLSGSLVKANYGQRPNTVKGANMKKFNMPNFDDDILINRDFNDISMIKGSTNFENTQYIEEISFNTDLHLIKKLQDPEIDKNLYNNGANNQNQFEKIFENLDQFEDGVRSQSDNDLEDEDDGAILQEQQEEYQESMQQIWKNCEEIMEKLQREKQEKIEKIIEEVTQEKFEKIAEVKASFDFMIKRLDQQKQKEKSEMKKKEKEEEVKLIQEQMEQLKKSKIEQVNNEYEEKKKELMGNTKETQIAQESKKLTINNHTRMFNNSRVSKQSYSSSHQKVAITPKNQKLITMIESPLKSQQSMNQSNQNSHINNNSNSRLLDLPPLPLKTQKSTPNKNIFSQASKNSSNHNSSLQDQSHLSQSATNQNNLSNTMISKNLEESATKIQEFQQDTPKINLDDVDLIVATDSLRLTTQNVSIAQNQLQVDLEETKQDNDTQVQEQEVAVVEVKQQQFTKDKKSNLQIATAPRQRIQLQLDMDDD